MSESIIEIRNEIEHDEGLKSKRRNLALLSSILIALNFSGAVIKEANTFLFKIEFTNQQGINELFFIATIYLMVRYYSYARKYHQSLSDIWCEHMLSNRKVFRYQKEDSGVYGLVGDCLNISALDEPGVESPKYKISGFFQRELVYSSRYLGEYGEEEYYDDFVSCNKFHEKWTPVKLLSLFMFEAKYQFSALINSREQLDLLGPYLLGWIALGLTCGKLEFITALFST